MRGAKSTATARTRRSAGRPWASRTLRAACLHAVLLIGSLAMAYPFLYGVLAAFSTVTDYQTATVLPFPRHLSLDNLRLVFAGADVPGMLARSAFRAAWYGFWPTLLALLSGYAFARLRFPFKRAALLVLLSGLMLPGQVSVVPTFIMMAHWPLAGGNNLWGQGGRGLLDSWGVLLTLGLLSGFELLLVMQAIRTVAVAYEEQARIDGAGLLRIIFTIVAPAIKPVLAALIVLNMIQDWNDYWTPFIFTDGGSLSTISLGVANYAGAIMADGQPNYPLLFTGAIVAMLPTIGLFLVFQRYVVQGIAAAGLQG
jgi:multiple sugar transport system permease protein